MKLHIELWRETKSLFLADFSIDGLNYYHQYEINNKLNQVTTVSDNRHLQHRHSWTSACFEINVGVCAEWLY